MSSFGITSLLWRGVGSGVASRTLLAIFILHVDPQDVPVAVEHLGVDSFSKVSTVGYGLVVCMGGDEEVDFESGTTNGHEIAGRMTGFWLCSKDLNRAFGNLVIFHLVCCQQGVQFAIRTEEPWDCEAKPAHRPEMQKNDSIEFRPPLGRLASCHIEHQRSDCHGQSNKPDGKPEVDVHLDFARPRSDLEYSSELSHFSCPTR